jgi:hypothetical protein
MNFLIDIKFTKILGQFKQKDIFKLNYSWHAITSFFLIFKFIYFQLLFLQYMIE